MEMALLTLVQAWTHQRGPTLLTGIVAMVLGVSSALGGTGGSAPVGDDESIARILVFEPGRVYSYDDLHQGDLIIGAGAPTNPGGCATTPLLNDPGVGVSVGDVRGLAIVRDPLTCNAMVVVRETRSSATRDTAICAGVWDGMSPGENRSNPCLGPHPNCWETGKACSIDLSMDGSCVMSLAAYVVYSHSLCPRVP